MITPRGSALPKPGTLATDTATYAVANLLSAIVPFLLLPILTRYLTPAEYGQVALFQSLTAGLSAFVSLSVHGAANRKFYDQTTSHHDMREFIGACLQIVSFSTILMVCLLLMVRGQLSTLAGLDEWLLIGSLATAAAGFVINLRLGQWQVRKKASCYAGFQVSQAAASFLIAIAAVVFLGLKAEGRIGSLLLTALLFAGLALVSLRRENLLGYSWRPDYLKEALAFGIPLMPHVVGNFLLGMADRLFINEELGQGAVGIYVVAAQITLVMAMLSDAINKAYVPWLFERLSRDIAAEKKQIVKYTYLYFLGALLIAGFMAAIGPVAVALLAGDGYEAAAPLIGWLALGQAFAGMYLMVTNYAFYAKQTGRLSLTTISMGAVNLLLILSLLPLFGLTGAAIAYCSAMGLRFLFTWWLAQKCHPMPWLSFR